MRLSTATTAEATSTAAPAPATASSAPRAPDAEAATHTIGGVRYDPPVGRAKPGTRPERLRRGEARWRRFPNQYGGGAAIHPGDTAHYLEHGIGFDDGRRAVVYVVEREAYVDIIHFHFVT